MSDTTTPQQNAPVEEAKAPEPTFEELQPEILWPDLSKDTFQVCGETVRIKLLKIKHVLRLNELFGPLIKDIGFEVQFISDFEELQAYLPSLIACVKHAGCLPEIIHLICQNDDKAITLEQIQDQGDKDGDLMIEDMAEIALILATKNQKVGGVVANFFSSAISAGKKAFQEKQALNAKPEKTPAEAEPVEETNGLTNPSTSSSS